MTKEQHPITPTPELMYDWLAQLNDLSCRTVFSEIAQWGADQELEACCEWLFTEDYDVAPVRLRAARRPKPPSLKQQALEAFERFTSGDNGIADDMRDGGIIRRALEALPE